MVGIWNITSSPIPMLEAEPSSGDTIQGLQENRLIPQKRRLSVTTSHAKRENPHVTLKMKGTRVISRYCMPRQGSFISAQPFST